MAPDGLDLAAVAPADWGLTRVHAAGSLRQVLTGLGHEFERAYRQPLALNFAAAGLLKDRLAAGEPSSLFASANMAHPQALVQAGRAHTLQAFARNRLCLLAAAPLPTHPQALAAHLLSPACRVGTSTPGADPSGDYAWQLFGRIEACGDLPPGGAAALQAKALQLTGRGDKAEHPGTGNLYGRLVVAGHADVFITYRTQALQACADFPALQMTELPEPWAIHAVYGCALLEPQPAGGQAFARLLLGAAGQALLRDHGFLPA